jgi:hypothetical protein
MPRNLTDEWSHNSTITLDVANVDDLLNTLAGGFPRIALLPFNFILGMVVLGSYVIAGIALKIIKSKVGKEGFARSPWWALVVGKLPINVPHLTSWLTRRERKSAYHPRTDGPIRRTDWEICWNPNWRNGSL